MSLIGRLFKMGIQVEYDQPVTFLNGITADITGDITGDVTGAVTGNVTGDVTGDLTGDQSGGTVTPTSLIRTSEYVQGIAGAKAGTTAGWTVRAGDNISLATCPASQTSATLVLPVTVDLRVGWTITGFKVIGQIESAGNTATLDADLRKHTSAAGDVADASVGAITQISATEDTAVATAKTGLSEVVAAGETFYVLLTATTAASTDVALQGITLTVSEV